MGESEDGSALDESLDQRDWEVLAAFGRVMLSAQLLETTIFQVAHLDRKTPKGWERAVRQVEGLLKQPKTDQARQLKDVEPELLDELTLALDVRNKLAHEGLMRYRIDSAVRGEAAADETLAMFRAIWLFIDSVRESLDSLADERLTALGVPDLNDEEMNALQESLQRWANEARPSGPAD